MGAAIRKPSPQQSSLGPGREACSGWKVDIALAAHRVDWLNAAKDKALGVEWNFTRTSKHYYVYGASFDL
jgi:hypothetical protein